MTRINSIPAAHPHRFASFDHEAFEPDDLTGRLPTWAAGLLIVLACSIFWVGALTILSWIIR